MTDGYCGFNLVCRYFPDEGCSVETVVEIEVWDWDMLTADDRIGSARVTLNTLIQKKPINLNPMSNGQLVVKIAEFQDVPTDRKLQIIKNHSKRVSKIALCL